MARYKVKRPYIAKNGELIEPGHILSGMHEGIFLNGLLKHDFVEAVKEELPRFAVTALSELAHLEIADLDYTEGDKKHFTFDEAMEIEKKYKDEGWRLPTRSEWALICEEFGQNKDGELDSKVLMDNLGLKKNGIKWEDGDITDAGIDGYYWSRSGVASTTAYYLGFNASGVYPSSGPAYRYNGFSLRFVRDRE